MNKSKAVLLAFMLLVPALSSIDPVFAEDKQFSVDEKFRRFELLVDCKPLSLIVEDLPEDARKIPLTTSDIVFAAESRLRSARIYTDKSGDPLLHIQVHVVGQAFSISVELMKSMYDPFSQVSTIIGSWERFGIGNYGQGGAAQAHVLSRLNGFIDEFIVEYFRVNDKACKQK